MAVSAARVVERAAHLRVDLLGPCSEASRQLELVYKTLARFTAHNDAAEALSSLALWAVAAGSC